jgi:hypothetical protein
MRTWLLLASLASLTGCPPPAEGAAPAGTPTDPVEVCAEVGQVCQRGGSSQLGVCTKSEAQCEAPDGCFTCMLQH